MGGGPAAEQHLYWAGLLCSGRPGRRLQHNSTVKGQPLQCSGLLLVRWMGRGVSGRGPQGPGGGCKRKLVGTQGRAEQGGSGLQDRHHHSLQRPCMARTSLGSSCTVQCTAQWVLPVRPTGVQHHPLWSLQGQFLAARAASKLPHARRFACLAQQGAVLTLYMPARAARCHLTSL